MPFDFDRAFSPEEGWPVLTVRPRSAHNGKRLTGTRLNGTRLNGAESADLNGTRPNVFALPTKEKGIHSMNIGWVLDKF